MAKSAPSPSTPGAPIDLDQPRWDQSTYWGRAKHFLLLTNPINFFASDKELDNAKAIVDEYSENINGTPVFTSVGDRVGNSRIAAVTGIFLVCVSKVCMALPAMTLVPILTNTAIQKCWFKPTSPAIMPFQIGLVCLCVTFATPLCCAFFEQKANISINTIERNLKDKALTLSPDTKTVYYNKGL